MKVLLLGIGNLLFGDEGVGVHFINYIGSRYTFEGEHQFDIIDGGTLAQRLIPIMVEYDEVIIVDTINAPGVKAGEVYFFDFEAIPDSLNWQGSAHEVEMLQTLHMMDLAGDRPKTMIMGIVPTVIEATEFSLSDGVANAIPLMEKTLLEYLKNMEIYSTLQREDVTIYSVLPHSFKSADAYSV
jgi:hydrogenase maturation protease